MTLLRYIYSILVFMLLVPLTVFFGIVGVIFAIFSKNLGHYVEKMYFSVILLLTFTKVRVEGIENLDLGKRYIVIANHQSFFDIITISASLPLQIRWVSKESIFRIPFIGQFMKVMGYIALPREKLKTSVSVIKDKVKNIDGCPTIFPEGTRSVDGRIQKFKRGFVILAKELGLDVLPIVVYGTINIMRKGEFVITPFQEVKLKVLKPIPNEVIISDKEIQEKLMKLFTDEITLFK